MKYSDCYNILKYMPERLVLELNIPVSNYKRGGRECVDYSEIKQLGYYEEYFLDRLHYTGYGYHEQYYFVRAGFGILDYSNISDVANFPDTDGRTKYVGIFWNGDYNGEGVLYFEDGTKQQGIWKDGNLIESKTIDVQQMLSDLKDF